jgi:hypothetical protein
VTLLDVLDTEVAIISASEQPSSRSTSMQTAKVNTHHPIIPFTLFQTRYMHAGLDIQLLSFIVESHLRAFLRETTVYLARPSAYPTSSSSQFFPPFFYCSSSGRD